MIPTNELITKVRNRNIKSILSNVFQSSSPPGSGDVTGPSSSTADNIATYNGSTGKIIKDGGSKISDLQLRSEKDAVGGYAGIWNRLAKGTTLDRYHAGQVSTPTFLASAVTITVLRCYPVWIYNPTTIDTLACEVTAGTTGNIRLGIYRDDGNGYPSSLSVDSGEITITAPGVFPKTVSITLAPGLYWFAHNANTANTFRCLATAGAVVPALGSPVTLAAHSDGYTIARTYQALPDPFPSGATNTAALTNKVAVFYRQI